MSFLRTLAGAFATSIVTTSWENDASVFRSEIVSNLKPDHGLELPVLDHLVQSQAVVLSTNHIFVVSAGIFIIAAFSIWLAPKPTRVADTSEAH